MSSPFFLPDGMLFSAIARRYRAHRFLPERFHGKAPLPPLGKDWGFFVSSPETMKTRPHHTGTVRYAEARNESQILLGKREPFREVENAERIRCGMQLAFLKGRYGLCPVPFLCYRSFNRYFKEIPAVCVFDVLRAGTFFDVPHATSGRIAKTIGRKLYEHTYAG